LRNRTGLQAPTYFEAGKPAAAAAGKKKKRTKRAPCFCKQANLPKNLTGCPQETIVISDDDDND
jgi:hypothetical protein